MPRVFVASDFQWSPGPGIPPAAAYHELILKERPDHVFLLGDIIADGYDHKDNSHHLLRLLERLPVPTYLLFGNNDLEFPAAMRRVRQRVAAMTHVRILEREVFSLEGNTCLALDYETTNSLRRLKETIAESMAELGGRRIDIIFAHAPNRRKPWLLMLKPKLIVSGHFGPGMLHVHTTRIVSSDRFPYNYYVLDLKAPGVINVREVAGLRSDQYEQLKAPSKRIFEMLLDARELFPLLGSKDDERKFADTLVSQGIPRPLVTEFVSGRGAQSFGSARTGDAAAKRG